MQIEGFRLHEGGHLSTSPDKFAKYLRCVGGNSKLSQNTAQTQSKAHNTASATHIYSGLLEVLETACCFGAMKAVLLQTGAEEGPRQKQHFCLSFQAGQ